MVFIFRLDLFFFQLKFEWKEIFQFLVIFRTDSLYKQKASFIRTFSIYSLERRDHFSSITRRKKDRAERYTLSLKNFRLRTALIKTRRVILEIPTYKKYLAKRDPPPFWDFCLLQPKEKCQALFSKLSKSLDQNEKSQFLKFWPINSLEQNESHQFVKFEPLYSFE